MVAAVVHIADVVPRAKQATSGGCASHRRFVTALQGNPGVGDHARANARGEILAGGLHLLCGRLWRLDAHFLALRLCRLVELLLSLAERGGEAHCLRRLVQRRNSPNARPSSYSGSCGKAHAGYAVQAQARRASGGHARVALQQRGEAEWRRLPKEACAAHHCRCHGVVGAAVGGNRRGWLRNERGSPARCLCSSRSCTVLSRGWKFKHAFAPRLCVTPDGVAARPTV